MSLKLYLTREEEKMLDGEYGESYRKCMRLLVTVGEMFEAKRMVKVKSCHVSGVSYKNIGEPGLKLLKSFFEEGVRVRVKSTLNPMGMDREKWKLTGLNKNFALKQLEILKIFGGMGFNLTCSCIPYLVGNKPKTGDHVAWAESSATIYANSVLGAKTNRESGLSALASALTGRTPLYGYHLEENRKPTIHVKVGYKPSNLLEIGALGYFIGKNFPESIPYFSGLDWLSMDGLKVLGSGMASSGAIALYHVKNLTPEAAKFSSKELKETEKFKVGLEEIKKTIQDLSEENSQPDAVFLGCPHYSLNQIRDVMLYMKKRRVKAKGKLWIFTSKKVYEKAKKIGYVNLIEKFGGLILNDTCMVVSPIENLGINSIYTDSCKAAHYMAGNFKVTLKSLTQCLEAVFS